MADSRNSAELQLTEGHLSDNEGGPNLANTIQHITELQLQRQRSGQHCSSSRLPQHILVETSKPKLSSVRSRAAFFEALNSPPRAASASAFCSSGSSNYQVIVRSKADRSKSSCSTEGLALHVLRHQLSVLAQYPQPAFEQFELQVQQISSNSSSPSALSGRTAAGCIAGQELEIVDQAAQVMVYPLTSAAELSLY